MVGLDLADFALDLLGEESGVCFSSLAMSGFCSVESERARSISSTEVFLVAFGIVLLD